jgi:beta-glucosidase
MSNHLPSNFLFGSATSAHQVEGGNINDWSIWETENAARLAAKANSRTNYGQGPTPAWSRIKAQAKSPANYISGEAAGHFTRYKSDLDIAAGLGLNAYRFSVEWSRIEPRPGHYDPAAVAHYVAMAQACRDRGQEPFVTLFHFTLPIWASDMGGWRSGEVIRHFGEFAGHMGKALQPLVANFCTINEPEVYSAMGYVTGLWPPNLQHPHYFRLIRHGLIRAHRAAFLALKTISPDLQVGFSSSQSWIVGESPYGRLMAKFLDHFANDYFTDKLSPQCDWLGLQYYIKRTVGQRPRHLRSDMGWGLHPEGHLPMLRKLANYGKPVYVTESGLADAADVHRANYIEGSLKSIADAVAEGIDCRGYFHWSLMDNFEWHEGFWPRFGLIEVDRRTLERTVRPSAHHYAALIKRYRSQD